MNNSNQFEDRYMAVDYGKRRVGIALSDPLKTFAYPYLTLKNDNKLLENIINIIKEKSVSTLILGFPNDSKFNNSSIINDIIKFKEKLLKFVNLSIQFYDESYSSKIAQKKVIESVTKRKKRRDKSILDMHSAAVILFEYLNQYNNKSE
jgi:putative Holliday junction resolvase